MAKKTQTCQQNKAWRKETSMKQKDTDWPVE